MIDEGRGIKSLTFHFVHNLKDASWCSRIGKPSRYVGIFVQSAYRVTGVVVWSRDHTGLGISSETRFC